MSKGIFGNMFDFNRDGNMSCFERAAEFSFISHVMSEVEKSNSSDTVIGDFSLDDYQVSELELEGLDLNELSLMDEWERREAIENAGLDPDDYDFD